MILPKPQQRGLSGQILLLVPGALGDSFCLFNNQDPEIWGGTLPWPQVSTSAWLAHALLEGEVKARASEVAGEGEGAEGSPAW